jgi:hypothetical protein
VDGGTAGFCAGGMCRTDQPRLDACAALTVDDACSFDGGGFFVDGFCETTPLGVMCMPNPCSGGFVGMQCWDGFSGVCVDEAGTLMCRDVYGPLRTPCADLADGDACGFTDDGASYEGTCTFAFGDFMCSSQGWRAAPCDGLAANDACALSIGGTVIYDGYCGDEDDVLTCGGGGGGELPGGIDGLGVDACGNIYASEYVNGTVFRISAEGDIERIADLPSGWIPNIKWGRGVGGFERDVMYIADRDEGRLFGVHVGVPGATEHFDIGAGP